MDSAPAIRALRAPCCDRVSNGSASVPRPKRIAVRRTHLAGERRHRRERPADRDRSALCLTLRTRVYFLAELVAAAEIRLAHLDGAVDFSRARNIGERPGPSFLFLFDRRRSPSLRRRTSPAPGRQT